jgi:hypothetical protein
VVVGQQGVPGHARLGRLHCGWIDLLAHASDSSPPSVGFGANTNLHSSDEQTVKALLAGLSRALVDHI